MASESSPKLLLWDHPVSSYAQKVRILLREKNIPFECRLPPGLGSGKPNPSFSAANPRLEVPTLIDGPTQIFDSKVILQYLEDKYPTPSLLASSASEKASARMLQEVCDGVFEAANWGAMEVMFYGRADDDAALKERVIKEYENQVRKLQEWLEGRLGEKEWFHGESFGMADLCVFPVVNRAASYGYGPRQGTRLYSWLQAAKKRDSVQQTAKEMEEGLKVLQERGGSIFAKGSGNRREYRDYRLEFLIKAGGMKIVEEGTRDDTIRFSWPYANL